jgi:YidC/Oxa1 family membrane protein insertase
LHYLIFKSYPFEPVEHATFFWINNLTNPDPLYILPILVGIATFFQSKLTAATSGPAAQNKMLLYFLPVMIGYISLKFPAGLCLYWVVFNVMGVLQQFIMNRLPDSDKEAVQ